jgi:hypothetical protein
LFEECADVRRQLRVVGATLCPACPAGCAPRQYAGQDERIRQYVQAVRIIEHFEPHYSPEEIVPRARSRLGENHYRLLANNCEHFCNWCLSGVSHSPQVERRLPLRLFGALFHA